jgi:hypothetical protein
VEIEPLIAALADGRALFGELGALLVAERACLVHHDLAAVEAANARRQALVDAIAAWERSAAGLLAAGPAPTDAAPTLRGAVESLPPARRAAAQAALKDLRGAAEAARREAAVNHILVERNLETVAHTLAIVTGRRPGITYGPKGGISRTAAGGLVARKE